VRHTVALTVTAVAIVAAAVTGMTRFASASLVNVTPRPLTVHNVTTRPDVPNVLRLVASEDTWNDDRATTTTHGSDPRLAIADGTQACFVIANATCTNVRNARTYVKFDLSGLPAGATVQSATIQMIGGPTTISSTPVTARRVTTAWSESTLTYNSRPSTSSTGVVTGASVASGGTEVLTLDVTAMVAARGTATIANGWELRPNGTNDSWWYSSEWSTAAQRPTLTVIYR
jgi:hypothetical protein